MNPAIVCLARSLKGTSLPATYREMWGFGPLWFVLALLLFSAAYVIARLGSTIELTEQKFPSNKTILAFSLSMGVAAFLVRLKFPIGTTVAGLQLGFFPLYVAMFILGIRAYRND